MRIYCRCCGAWIATLEKGSKIRKGADIEGVCKACKAKNNLDKTFNKFPDDLNDLKKIFGMS